MPFSLLILGALVFVVCVGLIVVAFLISAARQSGTSVVQQSANGQRYEAVTSFLTAAERSFFGVLQNAVSSEFVVFAKVRLADIVRPIKNPSRSGWQSAFNRICGKHVDFILCDPAGLNVLLAIELDDRSHGTLERGMRDDLVDSALRDSGIPILRVPARHSYAPGQLRNQINSLLGRSADLHSARSPRIVVPADDDSRYMPKN